MITKAYILDINPQSNKYYIHIPIFDKPGLSADNSTFSSALFYATLSHEPTSKESYKVGDTVFVGFENNDLNKPIIIGKLYTLGEEPNPTGAIDVKSLTVYDMAILPANTTIGSVNFSNISNFFTSINDKLNTINDHRHDDAYAHTSLTNNPHSVTASQVGLGTDSTPTFAGLNVGSGSATWTINDNTANVLTFKDGANKRLEIKSDGLYVNGSSTALGGGLSGSGTANQIAYFTEASAIASLSTATYPSLTELSYVKGVTSAIQTQLNNRPVVVSVAVSSTVSSASFTSVGSLTLVQGKRYYIVFAGKYSVIYGGTAGTPSIGVFFSNTTTSTVPTIDASGLINSSAGGEANSFVLYTASTLAAESAGSFVTGPSYSVASTNNAFMLGGIVYSGTGVTRTLYLGAKASVSSLGVKLTGQFMAFQLD